MQLSLRKANALQAEILAVLGKIVVPSQTVLNEFSKAEDVRAAAVKGIDNMKLKVNLVKILYNIRKEVGKANAAEIDGILTDIAESNKLIGIFGDVANAEPVEDSEVIQAKLDKLKLPSDDRYNRQTQLISSVFVQQEIDVCVQYALETKRKIVKLKDKLLELNISTKITLDDESTALLQKIGII